MSPAASTDIGVIEGYYGRPWGEDARIDTVRFLGRNGYAFFLYAPKAEPFLRRRWREPFPDDRREALRRLGEVCREGGVRFGAGLSPYEIFRGFDDAAREALDRKLATLDDLGVDDLALLFDDMRGDLPDLATRQLEVVRWVGERTGADRLFVCPTYYTDDPVLDRVFGDRPAGYLETLGRGLDPAVEVFWTGPEVVAREISVGHIERVSETLGRAPFLWDNYPVNDGARMSRHLHIRGFTGRPAALAEVTAGHAVNPALQSTLTRIPLLTLVESYERGPAYDYGAALRRAAREVAGPEVGAMLAEDLLDLQDVGLDRLGEREARLRNRYDGLDHPAAREVIAWLDGAYRITDEIVETQ